MEWKPRLIDPAELRAARDVTANAFGMSPRIKDDLFRMFEKLAETDRTFVVDDGSQVVGTGMSYTFQVAVPGGALPMAGVTWVGVLPTHRRRGILQALMRALADQAIEREEPLAGLTASEATIYRRFGYGVAARANTLVIETKNAEPLRPGPAPGTVRVITEDEAKTLLPTLWDQHWRRIPGELNRTPAYWPADALDPDDLREADGGPRFLAVHESPEGTPDGFVVYRFKNGGFREGNLLIVVTVAGASDDVESALFRYLLDIDFAWTLRWGRAPLDLPLRWTLADPRLTAVTDQYDYLWLRFLEIPRCMEARTYAADGGAVLEVIDDDRPELGGRFMLDAGPEGASCTRTTADPDVVLATPDLAALYLGDVPWSTLWRAGLIEERRPGTVDRLDALFRPRRAPFCGTPF